MPKLTHEKFIQIFQERRPEDAEKYEFVTKFQRGDLPITVKHSCGRIFNVEHAGYLIWYDLNRCGFVKCLCQQKRFGYSLQDLQNKIDDVYGFGEFTLIEINADANEFGRYFLRQGPIKIQHKCGNIIETWSTYEVLKAKYPICKKYSCQYEYYQKHPDYAHHQQIFVVSQIQEELDRVFGKNRYTCLNKTFDVFDEPITVRCNNCGSVFQTSLHAIIYDSRRHENPELGCPLCGRSTKFTQEKWEYTLKNVYNGEYKSAGPIVSYEKYTLLEHIPCGHKYEVSPHHFLSASVTCPYCTKNSWVPGQRSAGEKKVEEILKNLNIKFKPEYFVKPDFFINTKYSFRYDFALLDENNEPYAFIEFDGEQHFKPVEMFGGSTKFEAQKISDNLKNEYCIKNNIKLLRIPYWEFENIFILVEDFIYGNTKA